MTVTEVLYYVSGDEISFKRNKQNYVWKSMKSLSAFIVK